MPAATHGHTRHGRKTPEYEAFCGIRKRCSEAASLNDRRDYFDRGIRVSPEWLGRGGFERFLAEIGPRPSCDYSVDRIDTLKGYEPGNVRWATIRQQVRNRRNNWWLCLDGEWLIARDVADRLAVPYSSLANGLRGVQRVPAACRDLPCRRGPV